MKKHLAFLLALLMAFSLAACGEKAKEENLPVGSVDEQETGAISDLIDDLDNGKTETKQTVKSVLYTGNCLYMDILGEEYNSQDVVVIDEKEQLQPYTQVLKQTLATSLNALAPQGENISYRSLKALLHFKEAIDAFEKDTCLQRHQLLLIKIDATYTRDTSIKDLVLVEKENGERKLQVRVSQEEGFTADTSIYFTIWILVPDDLNLNYENDVEINVIKQ